MALKFECNRAGLTRDADKVELTEKQRKNRRTSIIASAAGIAIITITMFIMSAINNGDTFLAEEKFKEIADAAILIYVEDIDSGLTELSAAKSVDVDELIRVIDKQIEADQVVLDYQMPDELKDYDEFFAGLQALCSDDIECLEPIRETLENGTTPSQALMHNLFAVRGQNYLWVLQEYAQMKIDDAVGSLF